MATIITKSPSKRKKSSIKRTKISLKRSQRNKKVKAAIKTLAKAVSTKISKEDLTAKDLQESLKNYYSFVDKSAVKGIIHKNSAARKKARIAKKFNAALLAKKETVKV